MSVFKPKFISFDCYGTLIRFRMGDMARQMFADRVAPAQMDRFVGEFSAYRRDEVMGEWQPYADVLANALQRTCRRWKIECRDGEARKYYEAVPTWGPHDDVVEPLCRVAKEFPLVILSNAANEQIPKNVAKLIAPFHAVYTAEDAGAYKPRFRAFEYMLDTLGARPEDMLHVSSSFRYDLMAAHDLGIGNKVFVARGHEPSTAYYTHSEIRDLGGLPGLVGL
jgi:2-haloacid dehalogenase